MADYCVEDMLRGLAYTARFNGQTAGFYSVAQHSVIASHLAEMAFDDPDDSLGFARMMLLHDAEESIVGDMITPIKRLFPAFRAIGDAIRDAIFAHHGLQPGIPDKGHEIDRSLCATEIRDLQPLSSADSLLPPAIDWLAINPQSPEAAFQGIARRYRELFPDMPLIAIP